MRGTTTLTGIPTSSMSSSVIFARRSTCHSAVNRSKRFAASVTGFSRCMVMRLTIRTRLSLQFGLVVAMVIISLGAYLYFEVRTEILSAVDQGLQARAAQIE